MYLKKSHFLLLFIIFILFRPQHINSQSCTPTAADFAKGFFGYTDRECAPITATLEDVRYYNVDDGTPDDPNAISFEIIWGDGDTDIVPYGAGADEVNMVGSGRYRIPSISHEYPSSTTDCHYDVEIYLRVNGSRCDISLMSTTFYNWDTDDDGNGELILQEQVTGANVFPVCAGEEATVFFVDNSTLNCNPDANPDNPNTAKRWIQFEYGTGAYAAAAQIKSVEVGGHLVTDATGALDAGTYFGGVTTL